MALEHKKQGDVIVVYLRGRLDVHLSADVENELNSLMVRENDSHILLNLREVEYMSSSGLRIFVSTMRILKDKDRHLKLCSMNNAVKKIFEVVELMDMFEIYDDEGAALESFK